MKNLKLYLVLIAVVVVSGCSSNKYYVTYASDPVGAKVYCKGKNKGYTPVKLYYILDEETKSQGVLHTNPCGLKWASGVTAWADDQFNLKKFPHGVIITVPRPDAPNEHIDSQFELSLKHMRQQERHHQEQLQQGERQLQQSERQHQERQNTLKN